MKVSPTRKPVNEFMVGITETRRDAHDLFERLVAHTTPRGGIHGVDHWRRVLDNGLKLADATPGADPLIVAAFAALHDAERRNDGKDPEHGARATTLARRLAAAHILSLDSGQLETLCNALERHDRGLVSANATIGVCWDADRLDLVRIGKAPSIQLLSSPAARGRLPEIRAELLGEASRPAESTAGRDPLEQAR
jgi:uncharacterized protein